MCVLAFIYIFKPYNKKVTREKDKVFLQVKEEVATLTDEEWENLVPVGDLDVRVTFKRGTAELSTVDQEALTALAEKLKEKPRYFVKITATAMKSDDKAISNGNLQLAEARANTVAQWLMTSGIESHRIHTVSKLGTKPAVEFVLGERQE